MFLSSKSYHIRRCSIENKKSPYYVREGSTFLMIKCEMRSSQKCCFPFYQFCGLWVYDRLVIYDHFLSQDNNSNAVSNISSHSKYFPDEI